MGQMIMNCPHPSMSPGCGVMKLYSAHWLEDRRRVSELGFNQFSDKRGLDLFPPLATVWCLHSSPSSWLLSAPGLTALLLQHWDGAAGTQSLQRENPVLCWRSSVSGEKHMYPIRLGNLCSHKGRGQRVLAGGAGGSWSIYLGSTISII